MFICFISASLATLLYFSLGQQLPNGWEGLVLIVVLIFLIRGINNFLSEVIKRYLKMEAIYSKGGFLSINWALMNNCITSVITVIQI